MVWYGPLWLRMILYGALWSQIVLYGPLLSNVFLYGSLWFGMVPYGSLWSPMVLFCPVWSCMFRYGYELSGMGVYVPLWSSVVLYDLWHFKLPYCSIMFCKVSNSRRYWKLCVFVSIWPFWTIRSHTELYKATKAVKLFSVFFHSQVLLTSWSCSWMKFCMEMMQYIFCENSLNLHIWLTLLVFLSQCPKHICFYNIHYNWKN